MTAVHVCDACQEEAWGYPKKELLAEGWKWYDGKKGRSFVLCGDCEKVYAERRAAKVVK